MSSGKKLIFKKIQGYPGYKISSCGKIYSIFRKDSVGRNNSKSERFLKYSIVRQYYYVGLSNGVTRKMVRVHRIVAKTFLPNPKNLPQVNHKNGNKLDNRIENLEWVSAKENVKHAHATGLKTPHVGVSLAGLLPKDVLKIRKKYLAGMSQGNIAKEFGISQTGVWKIVNRMVWKHV